MKGFKPNYVIIPLITLMISGIGRYFASIGKPWYHTLNLPAVIPPSWVYGVAWNILYVLTTVVALWIFNIARKGVTWNIMMGLLVVNAIANGLWCYLFFYHQLIFAGLVDCGITLVTAMLLMILVAQESLYIALLLLPYVGWMAFATYQNYLIWMMN